ncbi:Colicin-E2 immunity protein [compost metagenome]
MSNSLSEMSELEFLTFVKKVYHDEYATEKEHIAAVFEFERLTEHPDGSDLLFYPEEGKDGPEAVVQEIKAWRAANGKPGFKSA